MLNECMMGEIIQCHIDYGDPESFVVGRLAYFDHDWFLMQDISTAGRWNGLALYMMCDIVSVKKFTDYVHRIESLIECRNEFCLRRTSTQSVLIVEDAVLQRGTDKEMYCIKQESGCIYPA